MMGDQAIPLEAAGRGRDAGRAKKRVCLGLVVAIVLVGGTLARYWIRRQPRGEGHLAAASTISPEMREIASTVTTSGTVRLRTGAQVRVGSQVSGIVQKLNVTVGSDIQKGDIIAQIDARPLQARVEQARTQAALRVLQSS